MVGAGASPAGRRAASVLAWLLPAAVVVAAVGGAVSLVTAADRGAVAWCGVVALMATAVLVAETVRRGRALAERQRHAAVLERLLAGQQTQTARLGTVLLPRAVARIQQGDFVTDVLADAASADADGHQLQDAHLTVLRSVLEAVSAEENLRESAQRAFVNIARRVQAIVHQQAQDLQDMEHRHGRSPEVFDDLLRLDHGFARVGRLADSMAVLGGARPGRQWNNAVPLYSVLRGAMSRILDYQRVDLHSVSEVAVIGPAVEPLIHALAELLDNATLYSPPQTRVHLTAVDVQAGIAVEIEDGGLGLTEEGRARAERMLAEAQAGIDLNDLGETPRLGLAVVGRLSRAYDFEVSLRPSAYRGVRAVLIVPQNLITTAPATGRVPGLGAVSMPRPEQPHPRQQPAPPQPLAQRLRSTGEREAAALSERTPGGLPQRRRSAPASSATGPGRVADRTIGRAATHDIDRIGPRSTARHAAEPAADGAAVPPGMWLSAFQNAVGSQAPTGVPAAHVSDESSDEVE
ncbi:sensor histidine kinase [Streptacidiphilus sp. P02-A3a]|uniref:sensor histidine kinase n=1 Tax=Streptacidiphilus sp. P02-A3a TaxID=2704468 RepID=UPI0015F9B5DF|nr:sensor histidine kinase [Streptacidiphilus sp. P02-A3a]QMU69716.1 sensor histidine kinase [Streptacidiphilus sp. P02-A3a]